MYQIRSGPAPSRGHDRHLYWFPSLHNSAIRCRDFNRQALEALNSGEWEFTYRWHYGNGRSTDYEVDLGRALKRTSALQGRQTDRQICRHTGSQAWRGVASRREGKQAGRDACAVAPSQGQLAVSALSLLLFFLIATSYHRLHFCFCRRRRRSPFFSGHVAPAQRNTLPYSNATRLPGYNTLLSRTQAR